MTSGLSLKKIVFIFLAAVVFYTAAFYLIEHRRGRNGPWRVAFASAGSASPPFLIINEPRLGIADLKITFPGQSAPATNAVIIFDQPQPVPFDVPFGQCVFLDLISQPGTVVLKLFGHDLQLLPRTLTIDSHERPWQSSTNIEVRP